ncbi:unnamed protein product [Toxocara canis]|uniref:J domain-containing protein n=1 Tax=Toxocara canis TaxID=6265 RepID=A0A183UG85_TOXCA|nr:unnamed protein product [Toxocara canis]
MEVRLEVPLVFIKDWFFKNKFLRRKSYYEILGVRRDASDEEIKQAFVRRSQQVSIQKTPLTKLDPPVLPFCWPFCLDVLNDFFPRNCFQLHPDGVEYKAEVKKSRDRYVPDLSPTEQFMRLKQAYDVLRKPNMRKEYDRELRWGRNELGSDELADMTVTEESTKSLQVTRTVMRGVRVAGQREHFFDPSVEHAKLQKNKKFAYAAVTLIFFVVMADGAYIRSALVDEVYVRRCAVRVMKRYSCSSFFPGSVLTAVASTMEPVQGLIMRSGLGALNEHLTSVLAPYSANRYVHGRYYSFRYLQYHPDVAGSRSDTVTTINFMAIKDAYDVLRDPEKRRTYDKQLSPRNTYQFESPSTQAPFGYPFTQRSESRRAPPPPRQTYTQAEYQRMFDQFRKRYESDAYQAFQEEMRQRAWEEQLRRRNEFLRRQSARYSHRRDFFRRRHEDTDFSRFDFVGSFGYNFEMLNKVLTVYLVVFFAVAITSAIYQRM